MILDNVEPIHWRCLLIGIAAREETLREADPLVASAQKLAVERNDHIGPFKFRNQAYSWSEGRRDSLVRFLCPERFIFTPDRPGNLASSSARRRSRVGEFLRSTRNAGVLCSGISQAFQEFLEGV